MAYVIIRRNYDFVGIGVRVYTMGHVTVHGMCILCSKTWAFMIVFLEGVSECPTFLYPCEIGLSGYLKLAPDFVCPLWNETVHAVCESHRLLLINPSPTTFKHWYCLAHG